MKLSSRLSSPLFPVVATIVLILSMRLATLGHLPFLDASDSRYALVAKLMVDDGEVFIPKIYRDGLAVPFWSKPPFHFWLEAASVKLLGENEFAARFPNFLASLCMLTLTGYCGYRLLGREQALLSVLLLATSGLFFFVAGSTLVDMTLSAAITGVMCSIVLSARSELKERVVWSYLFFGFLAIGFLTKGPIAIAFPGAAIGAWTLLRKDTRLIRNLPWLRGILCFLILTVPVFLLQELHTPGFLKHFFLNENFLRYFVADYGDKYGSGHRQPYGTSWFYLMVGFLPWTLLFLPMLSRERCRTALRDPTRLYLICWVAAPTILLMFARQLLATYLMPTFSGLALLLAAGIVDQQASQLNPRSARIVRLTMLLFALISLGVFGWTYSDEFTWVHGIVSIAVLLLLLLTANLMNAEQSVRHALNLGSLALGLFYTSQIINLCQYSERQYSVAAVVRLVEQRHKVHRPLLYFPFGVPYSAYLYANQRLIDGRNAMTLTLHSKNELILLRDKQVAEFRRRFGNRFQELMRHGKWRVFHTENHAGNCDTAMQRAHGRRPRISL